MTTHATHWGDGRLGQLARMEPTHRGRQFERFLRDLFRNDGFDVVIGPRAAAPRQTDLLAESAQHHLLVEAKWQQKPVGIDALDSHRARLDRTAHDFVGCIVSMSGFTESLIERVRDRRDRPILLITSDEVKWMETGRINCEWLVTQKLNAIRRDATVLIFKNEPLKWRRGDLPRTTEVIEIGDARVSSIVVEGDGREGTVFARNMRDLRWHRLGGNPVGMQLSIEIRNASDLAGVLSFLHDNFGLSGRGSFSIVQTGVSWFGVGAREFVDEARSISRRYAAFSGREWHHSEDLTYCDELGRYGTVVLATRQRIGPRGFLHSSELNLQFSGVPIDQHGLRMLCAQANQRDAFLVGIDDPRINRVRLPKPVALETIGLVQSIDSGHDTLVSGIVARNPFLGQHSVVKQLLAEADAPGQSALVNSTKLICVLGQWHGVGDRVDQYILVGFDTAWWANGAVIRPIANWGKLLYCPHRPKGTRVVRRAIVHTIGRGGPIKSSALKRGYRSKPRR